MSRKPTSQQLLNNILANASANGARAIQDRQSREAGTPIILRRLGSRHVGCQPLGRFQLHSDGTLYDGIGFEPDQIPTYFRTPTAEDRRRITALDNRIRKLQATRQTLMDEAWDRASPLTADQALAAARK